MKITKLVILFNYQKLLLGIIVSSFCFLASITLHHKILSNVLLFISGLIALNIVLSLVASYLTYDKSDLYRFEKLPNYINLNTFKNGIFIHASFDPLSSYLEKKFPNLNLTTCDIYENRHLDEKMITVSKKAFPPNPKELKIDPTKLPFKDNSKEIILAITSLHEILEHKKRVQFFNEAKRILKQDGYLIISEQMRNPINFIFFNIGAFHFLSKQKWKTAIKESNLKITTIKKINLFTEMIIIKNN